MKRLALAATAIVSLCFASCDKDSDNDLDLNLTDRQFVMMTSMGNTAEINAGNIAYNKATDQEVKMFGQMMVQEHTVAQNELKGIASQLRLHAPETLDSMHLAMANMLMAAPVGFQFDSMYIHSQVMDHQQTIALFQNEIENGSHPWLVRYAEKYLPKIQMHHHMADSIAQRF